MSKALRCDKCGTAFSPIAIGPADIFATITGLYIQGKIDYIKNRCERKPELNLCPKCTNEFIIFMEDFKNEESRMSAVALGELPEPGAISRACRT